MSRARCLALTVLLALALGPPARGQILARVEPAWSPYVRGPVGESPSGLLAEARATVAEEPAQVADVLAGAAAPELRGLRADALYHLGGERVLEAQRIYRALATARPRPEEEAWLHFMLGNIHKGLGFPEEAEPEYRTALEGPAGPWTPALRFDLAVLALEGGRHRDAAVALETWLRDFAGEPGRPLVLYLLGECRAALGEGREAVARYDAARALDPDAWAPRPRAAHALARALREQGRVSDAVALLERVAALRAGTREAARALLAVGEIWEERGRVDRAARAYARLLDGGTTPAEGAEAVLRLAVLGARHGDEVELTEPYPAYRIFYRPGPTLSEVVAGRDPAAAQRALRSQALLARKGERPEEALRLLARAFSDYPESPESGRAYETFMELFQERLDALAEGGRHARAVALFEELRDAAGWAPNRDVGPLALRAAEAYEALGAPAHARRVYRDLRTSGTRALDPAALDERILRTRVREGDPDALREWLGRWKADWRARVDLARHLEGEQPDEARRMFRRAAATAPGAEERQRILLEADGVLAARGDASEMLAALRRRAEAGAPEGHRDRLVEARLLFAAGEEAEAVRVYRELDGLGPEDRYLLALAERRSGRPDRASRILEGLAGDADPVFAELASFQLELSELLEDRQ